jgi:serine/threonine-protein kinase
VVHRDLKPENLLIDRYRRWRVADFGIAHALGDSAAGNSGTPAFAPPEQLLGEAQGPAADVYALAAIVYAVLSGRPPFPGADGPAVLAAQLAGPPALDGFAPPLAEWLATALAADPERRFPDAQAALAAWRRARAGAERAERRERWWRRAARALDAARPRRR